jgi:hydroxypyruvate isomerase
MTKRNKTSGLSRRTLLAAGTAAAAIVAPLTATASDPDKWKVTNGRVKQSVVSWCFGSMSVEQLAQHAAEMGIKSVELCSPEHWPMLKKYGLTCAIASSHGFVKGWNHLENHAECQEKIEKAINDAADFGCPSVITFSGMREKLSDEEGKKNTVAGLKKVIGLAEKKKVTLNIEMLNSRVDENMKGHPGYQCDTIEWAVDVCKAVGSPRMKLLFDIYHVQIMQGDVIVRLRQYKDYIGHYHTAGVPGRRELDDEQENNYPAIMKAIIDTGYDGFVGQEFIPTWKDPVAALRHAVRLCDV